MNNEPIDRETLRELAQRQRSARQSVDDSATITALLGMVLVGLLVLAFLGLATFGIMSAGILVVVGGVTGMVGFHYLVWGHWLSRLNQESDAADRQFWRSTEISPREDVQIPE